MPDQDPTSEAYHVLGQLNEGLQESQAELRKLRDQADQEHQDLMAQLEEAERMGDEAALQRLPTLIEQAQQAWIVANEELGDDTEDDQPPEDDDDAPSREATGPEDGASAIQEPEPAAGPDDGADAGGVRAPRPEA